MGKKVAAMVPCISALSLSKEDVTSKKIKLFSPMTVVMTDSEDLKLQFTFKCSGSNSKTCIT